MLDILFFDCLLVVTCDSLQEGWTALILAAGNGHTGCIRLLLEAGADLEVRENVRGSETFITSFLPFDANRNAENRF